MSRDKQIEEMAVEFAKINCNPKGCYSCDLCDEYGSLKLNCEDYLRYRTMAETFYNAGYRKAPEVAREIFEEIEEAIVQSNEISDIRMKELAPHTYKVMMEAGKLYYTAIIRAVSELKKKYTEEKEV